MIILQYKKIFVFNLKKLIIYDKYQFYKIMF